METKYEVRLKVYDLKSKNEYISFLEIQDDFLKIVSTSYSNRYFGNDIYIDKIKRKEFIVIVAFIKEDNVKELLIPVGTTFYKHTGKLSGMAVLPNFRRLNIAKKLLNYAQKNFSYIYGEVALNNVLMQRFLRMNGFTIVVDKRIIQKNLLSEKDKLSFLDEGVQGVTYIHTEHKSKRDKFKKFIMLEYRKKT